MRFFKYQLVNFDSSILNLKKYILLIKHKSHSNPDFFFFNIEINSIILNLGSEFCVIYRNYSEDKFKTLT